MNNNTPLEGFEQLYNIITRLRSPDGCPWDREQTPDSIKENLIEEAYECLDAIIENDNEHICEELGDIYLLVTFIAVMYEEKSIFGFDDIFESICSKLVRRHPHVFAESEADTSDKVLHQWEEIKDKVEGRQHDDSVLDSVPKHYPPLLKATKLQKKAAKNKFDWNRIDDVMSKLDEEIDELKVAVSNNDSDNIEEEIGDILFSIVNIARFLKVDPSTALTRTNTKFTARFKYIESRLKEDGRRLTDSNLEEMEQLWNEAKISLKALNQL
ncbi:MAG: nucleoside triphosphate pyrophosphohydrolase [Spirochaetales bacterium]|nr:nucleoside triphosphate pyrophosphohydrolase [Spirochaetales bacterium]